MLSRLISNSWAQAIHPPQPPQWLEPQVCVTRPGRNDCFDSDNVSILRIRMYFYKMIIDGRCVLNVLKSCNSFWEVGFYILVLFFCHIQKSETMGQREV